MDKKGLNDLIDKVALTGPGGRDKIKKILTEFAVNGGGEGGGGGNPFPSTMRHSLVVGHRI